MKIGVWHKKWFVPMVGSIIFCVLLSILFAFPDLFALFFVPNFVFEGNPYELVESLKHSCIWLSATYPPLYYYIIGLYTKLLQLFHLLPERLFDIYTCPVFEMLTTRKVLFFAKLPNLITHLIAAFFFSKLFETRKSMWFFVWFLNPILLFVNFIEGQFEVVPTLFILIFLYMVKKEKGLFLAFLMLGVGGALKHFPFLLMIPATLILSKQLSKRLVYIIATLIAYLIALIPVYGQGWLTSLSFSENFSMFSLGFLWGKTQVSWYMLGYVLILFFAHVERKRDFETLVRYLFLISALFFISTQWHPQRIVFLLPSLLWLMARYKNIRSFLTSFYALFFFYILFLYPGLFDHTLLLPTIGSSERMSYMFLSWNNSIIPSAIASALVGMLVWFGAIVAKDKKEMEELTPSWRFVGQATTVLVVYICLLLFLAFTHL